MVSLELVGTVLLSVFASVNCGGISTPTRYDFSYCKNSSIPESLSSTLDRILHEDRKYTTSDGQYLYEIELCPTTPADYDKVAVKQVEANDTTQQYNLGMFGAMQIIYGTNWVALDYYNGTEYRGEVKDPGCGGIPRRSIVMLSCDYEPDNQKKLSLLAESHYIDKAFYSCYYLFQITHCSVCKEGGCSRLGNALSPGSIILIVFFSVAGAYLLFGCMFQCFCRKARGYDLIPNKGFWQELGALQSDGCAYVCKCGGGDRGQYYSSPEGGTFGATGDSSTNHQSGGPAIGSLIGDEFEDDQLLAP